MVKKRRLNKHLSIKEVRILESKLSEEKQRVSSNLMKASTDIKSACVETKDSVDEANDNILVWQKARFNNRETFYLRKIIKSLEKIEEGVYGLCDECGNEIPFRRLEARLTSEMCIGCKEESESDERHNFFGRKSRSMGKSVQEALSS